MTNVSPPLVTSSDVGARAPSLTAEDQALLAEALNSAAFRVAPCLDDPVAVGIRAEARAILLRVVTRGEEVESWLESVTTGPYSAKFRADAGSVSVLAPGDQAALRELCPGSPGVVGPSPRGVFPPPRFEGRFGW